MKYTSSSFKCLAYKHFLYSLTSFILIRIAPIYLLYLSCQPFNVLLPTKWWFAEKLVGRAQRPKECFVCSSPQQWNLSSKALRNCSKHYLNDCVMEIQCVCACAHAYMHISQNGRIYASCDGRFNWTQCVFWPRCEKTGYICIVKHSQILFCDILKLEEKIKCFIDSKKFILLVPD